MDREEGPLNVLDQRALLAEIATLKAKAEDAEKEVESLKKALSHSGDQTGKMNLQKLKAQEDNKALKALLKERDTKWQQAEHRAAEYKERAEDAEKELKLAEGYAYEIGMGITHMSHDEKTPCVRCERDAAVEALEEIKKHSKEWAMGQNTLVRTGLLSIDGIVDKALKK